MTDDDDFQLPSFLLEAPRHYLEYLAYVACIVGLDAPVDRPDGATHAPIPWHLIEEIRHVMGQAINIDSVLADVRAMRALQGDVPERFQ